MIHTCAPFVTWTSNFFMDSFNLLPLRVVLDTSTHDLTQDFFQPLLARAAFYDRGVGYFSSGWLRVNARGQAESRRLS